MICIITKFEFANEEVLIEHCSMPRISLKRIRHPYS